MRHLDKITIAGFKSIRQQEVRLGPLNVLIGANGSGKSNFIQVFRLLNEIVSGDLQLSVARAGGAEQFLHFGSKRTEAIQLDFEFGQNGYGCSLVPTTEDSLVFAEETVRFHGQGYSSPSTQFLGSGHKETHLFESSQSRKTITIADHVLAAFKNWKLYHFHDTSTSARVKQLGDLADNEQLRPDAGNLAAFLYRLREKHPTAFQNIVDTLRLVTPFFADFNLRPDRLNPEKIRLEWKERGSDAYFNAHSLSDGTLRFLCLTTLLLQPRSPVTILIDEPELGLHPYAITVLAELFRSAATRSQLVISTQSVTLVNQLQPEEVLVVDRVDGESAFRHLEEEEISSWLEHYTLGELWEKNLLGGRPVG